MITCFQPTTRCNIISIIIKFKEYKYHGVLTMRKVYIRLRNATRKPKLSKDIIRIYEPKISQFASMHRAPKLKDISLRCLHSHKTWKKSHSNFCINYAKFFFIFVYIDKESLKLASRRVVKWLSNPWLGNIQLHNVNLPFLAI